MYTYYIYMCVIYIDVLTLRKFLSDDSEITSVGEKWLETHVRSHIAFACARALRDICVSVVRAHPRPQISESARAFASANFGKGARIRVRKFRKRRAHLRPQISDSACAYCVRKFLIVRAHIAYPHLLFMKVMIQMRLPKLFLIRLCTFVNIVNK